MPDQLKLPPTVLDRLRCPVCREALNVRDDQLECSSSACNARFPIVKGVPVLINECNSVFTIDEFVQSSRTALNQHRTSSKSRAIKNAIKRLIPSNSRNLSGKQNYATVAELLLKQADRPQVLIIGGGAKLGEGMESLVNEPRIEIVESNVSFGPTTVLVCDGHDIPFADASFDGVVIQAVLEHVADPYRCVEEIHRVLKPNGVVYAETPFMQQVHMGRYDFTRFTHLGHRRLFRKFTEVASGAACGPGMALAWSYQYFLVSFTRSRLVRALLWNFANATSFFLKYADPYIAATPGGLDAASGFYFIGHKSAQTLSDREIIQLYKGAIT